MNEIPWCPIYTADFLEETAELSHTEIGAYMFLLFHQWAKGYLPEDMSRLARVAKMSPEEFAPVWVVLESKFPPLEAIAHARAHPIYDVRRTDALRRREVAVANGRDGGLRRAENARHASSHPSSPASTEASSPATATPQAESKGGSTSSPPSPSSDPPSERERLSGGEAPPVRESPKGEKTPPKDIKPKDPDLVPLPAPVEEYATLIVKHCADMNARGRIAVSRVAGIRYALAECLKEIDGKWVFLAYGVHESIRHDADERYAVKVAKNAFKRGSIPEAAQQMIKPKEPAIVRPRPPADFNAWQEGRKTEWLKANGYV